MTSLKLASSSEYEAIADDSLKDEDNAAWLVHLTPDVQQAWIKRLYWLRWIDRLAEQDQLLQHGSDFETFYQAWKHLLQTGQVTSSHQHWQILNYLAQFEPLETAKQSATLQVWDRYIEAMRDYHQPNLAIKTLQDYEQMLERIAGSFFQCFPFVSVQHRQAICYFGLVDQFYNNLRDLREDALQGVCYFPEEVLTSFNVQRSDIVSMTCFDDPNYFRMMQFWVEEYLPTVRRKTLSLTLAKDLHPSWELLRDWCIHRYNRVERVLQSCRYNFQQFPERYWPEVRQDLANRAVPPAAQRIQRAYRLSEVSRFLRLSPVVIKTMQAGLQILEQWPLKETANRFSQVRATSHTLTKGSSQLSLTLVLKSQKAWEMVSHAAQTRG
ncbi:squalene/phytoene synthase family protein [Almyronema epifaneia]|uniref:Squalene/phytoene synthase family protein n=1 Tax=Almyronema epifaneia S1 TaxID=2991925 RepID=A0ABW6IGW6_9CYAN